MAAEVEADLEEPVMFILKRLVVYVFDFFVDVVVLDSGQSSSRPGGFGGGFFD
ncbi:MAG: hypothetical protein GY820_30280 [Gammaproteobacteria bacterium]|nr:hypothetical protein [Gammaproteobacteria bacterium]